MLYVVVRWLICEYRFVVAGLHLVVGVHVATGCGCRRIYAHVCQVDSKRWMRLDAVSYGYLCRNNRKRAESVAKICETKRDICGM